MTTESDDTPSTLEQLAGEYVLGTLNAEQRQQVQQRLQHDPELLAAVERWETRLLPLCDLAPAKTPAAHLWNRIEHSLDQLSSTPRPAPSAHTWWNSLALWRGLSAAGLAATLALGGLWLSAEPSSSTPTYVVVLVAPQNQAPGWIVQTRTPQEIQLIPLGKDSVPADRTLEFWTKGDDWQGPVSLGLVEPGQVLSVPLNALPPLQANQLFELTLEAAGGSTAGKPTGPVQFIGRAVKVI